MVNVEMSQNVTLFQIFGTKLRLPFMFGSGSERLRLLESTMLTMARRRAECGVLRVVLLLSMNFLVLATCPEGAVSLSGVCCVLCSCPRVAGKAECISEFSAVISMFSAGPSSTTNCTCKPGHQPDISTQSIDVSQIWIDLNMQHAHVCNHKYSSI